MVSTGGQWAACTQIFSLGFGPGRGIADDHLPDQQPRPTSTGTVTLTVVGLTVLGAAAKQWCVPRGGLCQAPLLSRRSPPRLAGDILLP